MISNILEKCGVSRVKERLLTRNHLGLSSTRETLLFAHLQISSDSIFVDLLAELNREKEAPLELLKQHIPSNKMKDMMLSSTFPALQTLSRPLEMNHVPASEFEAVLRFQVEPQLPYSIDEAVLTSCATGKNGPLNKFQVYSVLKEDLRGYLGDLEGLGMQPENTLPKAVALALFADCFLPKAPARIIIDLQDEETSCLLLMNGLPAAIRTSSISIRGDANDENHLETYSREISRILFSFEQILPGVNELPITFTGHVERDPLILSLLAKLLGHPSEQLSKKPKHILLHDSISLEECSAFASAIGAALMGSPYKRLNKQLFLNLRKEELAYPQKWHRWKKDFIAYFSLLSLSALFCLFISHSLDRDPERLVREQYAAYVTQFGKSADTVEKDFAKQENGLEKELQTLSKSDIRERLAFIEKHYRLPGELYALHPDVPLISDTLAWLKDLKESSGMKIDSFSYQLKHPDKEHPKERYQVRVSLLFSMPSPEAAKDLREALLKPNRFVDPSQELTWSVEKGRYKASFALKDRTAYP